MLKEERANLMSENEDLYGKVVFTFLSNNCYVSIFFLFLNIFLCKNHGSFVTDFLLIQ